MAQVEIGYSLPRAAQVSLIINDMTGHVVRELLHAAPRKEGQNYESWDGLDDAGRPVPAGSYTWKLLSTQGLHAEYLLTLGTNPNPRWDTWPANHNGLTTVASDETGLYFGGPGEGCIVMLKQTCADREADEKRIWTIPNWLEAWQGAGVLTTAAGRVFMLQGNGKIQVLDGATGKTLQTWPSPYSAAEAKTIVHWTGVLRQMDIAGRGKELVGSYGLQNAVRWLDPENGKTVDEAMVPAPQGVAVGPNRTVYVISQDSVLGVTRDDKTPRIIVAAGQLKGAGALDVDPTNGDLLVAESRIAGDDSGQQVKRFSPVGKLLQTYGPRGGRISDGLYDPTGFNGIQDLTTLPDGGFIITEPWKAPRRTARFDKEGKLLREWYGGQLYANFADPDPADPTLVWLDSNFGELIQAKADYVNKTWKVLATYQYQGLANGLVAGPSHGGARWRVLHRGKDTYLALAQTPTVLRVDEAKGKLTPLVVSAVHLVVPWAAKPWGQTPQWLADMLGNNPKTKTQSYFWADNNGDGMPQKEEMNLSEWSTWGNGWMVDSGFNYYYTSEVYEAGQPKLVVYKIPVTGWSSDGVPQYSDWAHATVVAHPPGRVQSNCHSTAHGQSRRGAPGCIQHRIRRPWRQIVWARLVGRTRRREQGHPLG